MDKAKSLLEQIQSINLKYEKELRDNKFAFNVFSLLRKEHDEVNLHSRFLVELLDPRGSHSQENYFLALFLKQIDFSSFELKNINVRREHNNIDILINNNQEQAIIVENKINAKDQPRQLQRYYEAMEGKGYKDIKIVYLTLYGDEPSDQSRGKLDNHSLKILSYKDDIIAWIKQSIENKALEPAIKETLIQYQRLIKKLTGQSFPEGYIMEIKELLIDEKNIELAIGLSQAVVEAKIDIQLAFWEELEKKLKEAGYKITIDQKYSKDKVRTYYTSRKSDRYYYGIMFEISHLEDSDRLLFFVELGSYIYFGFTISRGGDGNRRIALNPQYNYLAEILKIVDVDFKRNEWWIGIKDPARMYNFETFDSPNVFALANPSNRVNYVNELVGEIKKLVSDFNLEYNKHVSLG